MSTGLPPQLWFAPAMAGIMLIVFGVLVLIFPWILEFIVGGVLIFAGATMVGIAWSARSNVTYRRFDDEGL